MEAVYAELAERVGFPKSRFIPKVFRKLVTPEDARLLLALPRPPEELAAEFEMDVAAIEAKLDEFDRKGVAIPLEKGGARQYFCVNNVIQVHDATIHAILAERYPGADYEIVRMWERFRETEWFEVMRARETAERHSRVLPLPGTVDGELLPHEDLEQILGKAEQIAVVPCPCRVNRVREDKCDKPVDVCLSLTPGAVKYIAESGTGEVLNRDQAFALLDRVKESGLVPTTNGAEKVTQFCFCCTDCCLLLMGAARYGYHTTEKSRFEARVEPERCTGCEACVERCPFEAIEMREVSGSDDALAHVDADECYGCGACVVTCPADALSLCEVRPPEYIDRPHDVLPVEA